MSGDTKEKRWLVKKNFEIIGPFSDAEVEEGLSTGQFSILDSACLPDRQVWLCLGNYEKFSEFMDKTKRVSGTTAQTLLSRITDTIFLNTNTNTLTDTGELDSSSGSPPVVEDVSYEVVDEKQIFNKLIKMIFQKRIIVPLSVFIVVILVGFIVL